MSDSEKNLKDTTSQSDFSITDTNTLRLSYTKTNKLIAALYMVTDIMDTTEPVRSKLRTLGAGVISDVNSTQNSSKTVLTLNSKILEILSFLDIAGAVGMISEMNKNILKKEFVSLRNSVNELGEDFGYSAIANLLKNEETFTVIPPIMDTSGAVDRTASTRIGVQKGHALMQALSDRIGSMSDTKPTRKNLGNANVFNTNKDKFDGLKQDRRNEIVSIIKKNGDSSTITDIKNQARGALASCGDKTLQRELSSMVADGVLNKTGEKRWSRYSIK